MNYALIFAGGVGTRMNARALPKQFLEINAKPIIIHTLEHFDAHPEIDAICVVCLADWIERLRAMLGKFGIRKVRWVVPGGATALDSQYYGLRALDPGEGDIVLIHDGVRPMIGEKLISDCIASVRRFGSGVCVAPATETVVLSDGEGQIRTAIQRSECRLARAPQAFYAREILAVHERALADGRHDFIDSASMMLGYGRQVYVVEGPPENIKVTTPVDFYLCKAILDARESAQLYGL